MLPKAARPFGTIRSAVIKNGETQIKYFLVRLQGRKKSLYNKDFLRP